jgi:hypothetical protein
MSHTTPVDERANRPAPMNPDYLALGPGQVYCLRCVGLKPSTRAEPGINYDRPSKDLVRGPRCNNREQRKCIVLAVYEVEEAARTVVLPAAYQHSVSVRLYAACASICLVYLPLRAALLHFAR